MKGKFVGFYRLGAQNCRLIIMSGTGGSFNFTPTETSIPEVRVGGDDETFGGVVESLVHETLEFAMCEMKLRYEHADEKTWSADRFYFLMNHPQLAEVSVIAGEFIESCYADLKKAWLEFKRKPKKKPKRRKR